MTDQESIEYLLQRLDRKLIRACNLRKDPSDLIEGLSSYQVRQLRKAVHESLDAMRDRRDFQNKMGERHGA